MATHIQGNANTNRETPTEAKSNRSNFSKVNLNKTELFWEEFSVDFKDSTSWV